jgi:hypothetical protein
VVPRLLFVSFLCVLLQPPSRSQDDPGLTLWKSIKKALLGLHGDEYFETSMKGALLPMLHGKVVKIEPAVVAWNHRVGD